jgi:hypothetical protein
MGNLSYVGLRQLLNSHVVELVFTRRHLKMGYSIGRRMLCTLDKNLLNSLPGKITLNFRMPTQPPAYNAKAYNLIVVWDLFWQDYRAIPVDAVNVVSAIPSRTKKEQEEYWKYHVMRFQNMSAKDKERYMNS